MRHGTRYGWVQGCRCDECEEGRRVADRLRRQRRHERAKADPSIIPAHGELGYADYGCRCAVCTHGKTEARRRQTSTQPAKRWTEEDIARALHVYATEGYRAAAKHGIANGSTIRRWAIARGVECFDPPVVHGQSRYQQYGCRCEVCVTAYRETMKRAKADRMARLDEAPHGTETAYLNWGCRCEPCKDAGSLRNQRGRIRRKAGLTRK